MDDAELRALVRNSLARLRTVPLAPASSVPPRGAHASHVLLALGPGGDADGACLIEPSVQCTHCGYCLSYGH